MEFQGYKSVRDIAPTLTAHDGRGGESCAWFEIEDEQEIKQDVDRQQDTANKRGGVWIDAYNQSVNTEVAGTITTRVDSSNHYWVTEPTAKIIPLVPWSRPGKPTDICPTITTSAFEHNNYVMEPQILTQRRTDEGRELRKQGIEAFKYKELVPREDGVSNTLTSVQHDNYLLEPAQVIGSNQANAYVGSVEGVAPCVNAAAGMGGGHVAMITEEPKIVGYTRDDKGRVESYHFKDTSNTLHTGGGTTAQYVAEPNKTKTTMYRIRKLTPKECFRLMDVEDTDIEKIEAYPWKSYAEREDALSGLSEKERKRELRKGISKSAKYKLAGNSIVVSCLYNIFRTLFIDNQPENERQQPNQPSLFDL